MFGGKVLRKLSPDRKSVLNTQKYMYRSNEYGR